MRTLFEPCACPSRSARMSRGSLVILHLRIFVFTWVGVMRAIRDAVRDADQSFPFRLFMFNVLCSSERARRLIVMLLLSFGVSFET